MNSEAYKDISYIRFYAKEIKKERVKEHDFLITLTLTCRIDGRDERLPILLNKEYMQVITD